MGLCPARRRASSYRLRQALDACGVRVSNKVLEAMVLRFSSPPALTHIDEDAFLHALATIHLAHRTYTFTSLTARIHSCTHCPSVV